MKGKKEQLYKCATCATTRPGFADVRKKKEALVGGLGDNVFAGEVEFSFGNSTTSKPTTSSADDGLDIFGGSSADTAPANGAVDLFGGANTTATATTGDDGDDGVADLFSGATTSTLSTADHASDGGLDIFKTTTVRDMPSHVRRIDHNQILFTGMLAFATSHLVERFR